MSKPNSPKPEYRDIIAALLKGLRSNALVAGNRSHKDLIHEFMEWITKDNPKFSAADAKLLFLGPGGEKKGMLDQCGVTKKTDDKKFAGAAKLALSLVAYLLDPEGNDTCAAEFTTVLSTVQLPVFVSMKLGLFILQNEEDIREKAFFVVKAIITNTSHQVNHFVRQAQAQDAFRDWKESAEEEEKEERPPPSKWADVQLMNIDAWEKAQEDAAAANLFEEEEDMEKDPLGVVRTTVEVVDPAKMKKKKKTKRYKAMLKNMAGIKDTDEGDQKEKKGDVSDTEEEGPEQVVEGSIRTNDRDFSSALFLSVVHHTTSFENLEHGLTKLTSNVIASNARVTHLVKQNFNSFVLCQQTVDSLADMVGAEMSRGGGGQIVSLVDKLQHASDSAHTLFAPILQREQSCGKMRRMIINVLQRYPLLFKLPGRLREGIINGDWTSVARDFKKASSMLSSLPHDRRISLQAALGVTPRDQLDEDDEKADEAKDSDSDDEVFDDDEYDEDGTNLSLQARRANKANRREDSESKSETSQVIDDPEANQSNPGTEKEYSVYEDDEYDEDGHNLSLLHRIADRKAGKTESSPRLGAQADPAATDPAGDPDDSDDESTLKTTAEADSAVSEFPDRVLQGILQVNARNVRAWRWSKYINNDLLLLLLFIVIIIFLILSYRSNRNNNNNINHYSDNVYINAILFLCN
jgi:hypothetical protein